jgi:hypothetical protein
MTVSIRIWREASGRWPVLPRGESRRREVGDPVPTVVSLLVLDNLQVTRRAAFTARGDLVQGLT